MPLSDSQRVASEIQAINQTITDGFVENRRQHDTINVVLDNVTTQMQTINESLILERERGHQRDKRISREAAKVDAIESRIEDRIERLQHGETTGQIEIARMEAARKAYDDARNAQADHARAQNDASDRKWKRIAQMVTVIAALLGGATGYQCSLTHDAPPAAQKSEVKR